MGTPEFTLADDPVGELLLRCLECDDRNQALEQVCAAHPHHADELRRRMCLLTAYGMMAQPEADASEPALGLGPFRFVRKLGSGAGGIVWLAEQAPLGRSVALKVLRGGALSGERARKRFALEAKAIASLDHPGICPVHEVGETDGVPWMAMRLVEGRALDEMLDEARAAGQDALRLELEGKPSSTTSGACTSVLALVEKLARAADVAHEAGFVHRDLKPANVMVAASGEPVILDFGLARRLADEAQTMTMSGDLVGTPAYMAPEQVKGHQRAIDRRTDVWALGVLLYECVTLRLPFEALDRETLYRQILSEGFAHPGHRLDRDLRTILETCLAKEPERRYATALELADDLRRLRVHEPIRARRADLVLRTRRWIERNPVVSTLLLVLVLALLGTSVLLLRLESTLRERSAIALASAAAEAAQSETLVAALLARESLRVTPTPQGAGRLYESLGRLHERMQCVHPGQVGLVRFCQGDTHVVSACADGIARLWTRSGRCVREFRGHTAPIWALEISPTDSTSFATGSVDGTVCLWSLGREDPIVLRSDRDRRPAINVEFASSGSFLVTSHGGHILRWRSDGTDPTTVKVYERKVMDLAISPDDRLLVTAVLGGTAELIDVESGESVRLEGHSSRAWHARFSPDGQFFVTASGDKGPYGLDDPADRRCEALIWDRHGTLVKRLPAERDSIFSMDCSRDHVLTATDKGRISVFTRTGEPLQTFQLGDLHVWAARFIADGTRILSANGKEIFITTLDGFVLSRIRAHSGVVADAVMSGDGSWVASAGWDGTVRLFDVANRPVPSIRVGSRLMSRISVCDDGTRFACRLADSSVGVHDMTGKRVARVASAAPTRWAAYSPDGRWIATASPVHRVEVWRLGGAVARCSFQVERGLSELLYFAADSKSILVESPAGLVRVFDLDGHETAQWQASDAVSQDRELAALDTTAENRVATVSKRGVVKLWQIHGRTAQAVAAFEVPRPAGPRVGSMRFTPDGHELVVSLGARTFWRIDLQRGTVHPVELPRGHAHRIAVAPDGGLIAVCGTRLVHLYDRVRDTFIVSFAGHDHVVADVALTRLGSLLTISSDGSCRIWPADLGELERLADSVLYRSFTREERGRYEHLLPH